MKSLVVTEQEAEQRLDRVLALLEPQLGLRGRRRLCGLGGVLVNGRSAPEACKVRVGDTVEIVAAGGEAALNGEDAGSRSGRGVLPFSGLSASVQTARRGAALVRQGEHLAALSKPAGMHTESLAGKVDASLQALLPDLLSSVPDSMTLGVTANAFPRLLNRLDFPTSGLVLAALDREGSELWQNAQQRGLTKKRYLALLEGELTEERVSRQRLSLKGRERVLVELAEHADTRRHTRFTPLAVLGVEEIRLFLERIGEGVWPMRGLGASSVTLTGCIILKGARHQIRAHSAAQGFPLLGDRRYGANWTPPTESDVLSDTHANMRSDMSGNITPESERFFLHHGRVSLPGFAVSCPPDWLEQLPAHASSAARAWLDGSDKESS